VFFLSTIILTSGAVQAQTPSVEFSGFARAVVGHLDDDNLSFLDYDNGYSFSEQSLFGLRSDVIFNDKISLVAQAIVHGSKAKDNGIQWLYLDYQPISNLSLKLGRQRLPVFNYSDVIDVGFAYSWITPPTQVYTTYFFSEIDGLLAQYDFSRTSFSGSIAAYWGQFDGDIRISSSESVSTEETAYIKGVYSSINYRDFVFGAAYHEARTNIEFQTLSEFKDVLRMFNFARSANELGVDDKVRFYKLAASYNSLKFFAETEFTRIDSDASFVPRVDAAYLILGYNFSPFSIHATIAYSNAIYSAPLNEIPLGVNPQLDTLHVSFESIFASVPEDSLRSLALGGRYDWKYNIAFKAEVTMLRGHDNDRAFFTVEDPLNPKREAVLLQLAAEWVF
jgi:hypothetical protein